MIGIYKIISPSGKIYIGQSWDIKSRWAKYRRENCVKQPALNASFVKYGVLLHKFEVIQLFPVDIEQQVLDNYEIFCISQYKETGIKTMNIRDGGSRGKHSEESKIKLSISQKGVRKANSGSFKKGEHKYILTAEQRNKISKSNTGKKRSKEHSKRISELHTGNKYKLGSKHSAETKNKISVAKKGRVFSDEEKLAHSIAIKKWWDNRKGGILF